MANPFVAKLVSRIPVDVAFPTNKLFGEPMVLVAK